MNGLRDTGETTKAALRERIRRFALRGRQRAAGEATRDRARDAYDSLRPHDPVIRHGWLFADQWVQESADESRGGGIWTIRSARAGRQTAREAMSEIWIERWI